MQRREGSKDRLNVNHLLENIIMNGQYFPISSVLGSGNSVAYFVQGWATIDIDMLKKRRVEDIVFIAASGAVGGGGMTVRLYDMTNATEIATLLFSAAESNSIKSVTVKTYLLAKSGRLLLNGAYKRTAAPIAVNNLCSTGLNIYSKLPGVEV